MAAKCANVRKPEPDGSGCTHAKRDNGLAIHAPATAGASCLHEHHGHPPSRYSDRRRLLLIFPTKVHKIVAAAHSGKVYNLPTANRGASSSLANSLTIYRLH